MSDIESLEKLFDWCFCLGSDPCKSCGKQVQGIAFDIENEINEQMEKLERHNKILQADVDLYRSRWMARGAMIAKQKKHIAELEALLFEGSET